MPKEDMVALGKKIVQTFVNAHLCRTTSDVDFLLERTEDKDILEFALNKGLKLSKEDIEEMPSVIWNIKTFYGASPIGSQSHWNVLCARLKGFV